MAEITSAIGVQASTTYQYFANKDEIVWGIPGEVMAEDTERAKQKFEGGATGLAKITALLEFMADELSRNQAKVRFMAQFDAMYARHWPAERLLMLKHKASAATSNIPRMELAADTGWKFLLGDSDGAEAASFAGTSWRAVDLPHDWSIESRQTKTTPAARVEVFPGGVGCIARPSRPGGLEGNRVTIEFDGVYVL